MPIFIGVSFIINLDYIGLLMSGVVEKQSGGFDENRRESLVVEYRHPRSPMEYLFACRGDLYVTQPRMRGAKRAYDVYGTRARLLRILGESRVCIVDVTDLGRGIQEKIRETRHGIRAASD